MFVPPNSYADILMPNVMELESAAFRRWLGNEGRALINVVSIPIKETPQRFLAPSTIWGHNEKVLAMYGGEGPHPTMLVPWSWTSSLHHWQK